MLGLGRASQYAGWWSSGSPTAGMTLTFTVDVPQVALASPRYYTDFANCSNSSVNMAIFVESGNNAFNLSGVGKQPKCSITSFTLKVGTDFCASPTDYETGMAYYSDLNNNGQDNFYNNGIFTSPYGISINSETVNLELSDAEFDALRNRWITILSASSNTSSTFSNWTGGTDSGNTGMAGRLLVIDLELGEILHQTDGWALDANTAQQFGNINLDNTWTLGYESSTYWVDPFVYFGPNGVGSGNRNQSQIGSMWTTIGATLDPVEHYKELSGFGIGPEAAGIKAWYYQVANSAGTAQTESGNTWGYRQSIPSGSRAPANTIIQISTAFGATDTPHWIEIN